MIAPRVSVSLVPLLMAFRGIIRAVFSDPPLDGMDGLCQAIGVMLTDNVDFIALIAWLFNLALSTLRPGSKFVFNLLADSVNYLRLKVLSV